MENFTFVLGFLPWIVFAVVALPAWLLLGGWFFLQASSASDPVQGMVAYEAHVAGFLAGIALVLLLDRRRGRRGQATFHPTGRQDLGRG